MGRDAHQINDLHTEWTPSAVAQSLAEFLPTDLAASIQINAPFNRERERERNGVN